MGNEKFMLDVCCGKRMMWFDKSNGNVIYMDIREECKPDIVGDFRDLHMFNDDTFNLVVMDPPHDIFHKKENRDSQFVNNFGILDHKTWEADLKKGLSECMRVLKPMGILIFKWNTHDAKLKRILPLLPCNPLFMNTIRKLNTHNSETIWFCFMKMAGKRGEAGLGDQINPN